LLAAAKAGRRLSLPDFQHAIEARLGLCVAAHSFFRRYDLLIGPVMPISAFDITRNVPAGYSDEDWSWCPYTYPWNLTGLPAASVPVGFTAAGLPVGVQIIGGVGAEPAILRAAAAIEHAQPCHLTRPAY
jgi:aspartyl-tRNA(Asn)/glutamyl-tRNA(Gln) amidotransferase subunit A